MAIKKEQCRTRAISSKKTLFEEEQHKFEYLAEREKVQLAEEQAQRLQTLRNSHH